MLRGHRELPKGAGSEGKRGQKRLGRGDKGGKRGRVPPCHPGWRTGVCSRRNLAAERHGSLFHCSTSDHASPFFFTQPGVSCRSPRTTASMPVYGTNAHCGTAHSSPEPPGPAVQPASASPTLGLQARATAPGCSGLCLRASSTAAPPSPASAAPQRCSSTLAAAAGTVATFNPSTEQPAQYFGLDGPGYAVVS